ncbi:hypothetical protein Syun_023905 [Stephania yunnanensis]|uniref:F-box domain-containing protein n=1 Tax=Stephania yunnanensis TaxID=152371 RepID=A0AAP0I3X0_9MAGN
MVGKSKKIEILNENSTFGDIDEELVMLNILPRLPINQIFKFKLVCKKWRNFISRDTFVTTYNSINNPKNCPSSSTFYYLADTDRVISSTDRDNQFQFPQPLSVILRGTFYVEGSTNGFLYGQCYHEKREIFVCNPITKQVVYIHKPKDLHTVSLAYDPHDTNGFGGFKIVGVYAFFDFHSKQFQFEVYSSKTGEWGTSNAPKLKVPLSDSYMRPCGSAYNRGKVYCLFTVNVIWFDVEKDIAGIVSCPDIQGQNLSLFPSTLGVCHEYGNGGEISYSRVTVEGGIKIWMLKNAGGGGGFEWVIRHDLGLPVVCESIWNILAGIHVRESVNKAVEHSKVSFPMPYLGGEELWFWLSWRHHKGNLFSINMRSQELNFINCDLVSRYVWPFIPTLLPCSI